MSLRVICALTNYHNHLFSPRDKKGPLVDELSEVRAAKKALECSGKQDGRDGRSPDTDVLF